MGKHCSCSVTKSWNVCQHKLLHMKIQLILQIKKKKPTSDYTRKKRNLLVIVPTSNEIFVFTESRFKTPLKISQFSFPAQNRLKQSSLQRALSSQVLNIQRWKLHNLSGHWLLDLSQSFLCLNTIYWILARACFFQCNGYQWKRTGNYLRYFWC